ncbi:MULTISPECIES: hypothetical protein [Tatumella]|mgnify:FL=1|uniref:Oxidoreductase n=1 Tax=Tatumella punctata TaxID=399969 RepID=A0ABW1VKV1_9GAMM|nr:MULTISPECIES: hypothetical protein [unclassified Tatumella]MBS0856509.1 hypothetical protein [Tatumella sp. JGM16]MBS0893640.1 hypothetical protein [Tatumella sp. JGM130]MBS0911509.1 hypothetical protein [Tatumella sp. JGM91]
MELRHSHSHYTLLSESQATSAPQTVPAGSCGDSLWQQADLFAGLMQHPALPAGLRRLLDPVSRQSAAVYSRLFPEGPCPEQHCSLSLYDRFNIALTIAQLSDINPLCDFYARHLAPLPGPPGTRQNNHRLTDITQYARQLACAPATAVPPSLTRLLGTGLTAADILTLHQICGFIRWQSRMMAGIIALTGIRLSAAFMAAAAPVFPGWRTDSVSEKLPFIGLHSIGPVHLNVLRQVAALGQPQLPAGIIAHAPLAAEAWLTLRDTQVSPLSSPGCHRIDRQIQAEITAAMGEQPPGNPAIRRFIHQLIQIPVHYDTSNAENLLRQGWTMAALLQLLFRVSARGWDQSLMLLA